MKIATWIIAASVAVLALGLVVVPFTAGAVSEPAPSAQTTFDAVADKMESNQKTFDAVADKMESNQKTFDAVADGL